MTTVKQRNRHRPDEGVWGDCHRAAIASVLDKPLDEVPHFGDGGPDSAEFDRREVAYLRSQGLVRLLILYCGDSLENVLRAVGQLNPGVYYLLGGESRTGVNHTVVCLGDRIIHDPSPADAGIVAPCDDGYYWITLFGSLAAAEGGAA